MCGKRIKYLRNGFNTWDVLCMENEVCMWEIA